MQRSTEPSGGISKTGTSLSDELKVRDLQQMILNLEHQATRERERRTFLSAELQRLDERLSVLEKIDSIVIEPPKWTRPPSKKGVSHIGAPVLMLSDCHWDEVVRPEEVEGANKYNREIAVARLRNVFDGHVKVLRCYISGLKFEGVHLLLGGDNLSGLIHEELTQTNEDTVFGGLDFWSEQLAAFITAEADEFGHVHIAGVVGNHGRLTRKPRAKLRVRDNLDWLLYRMVARALSGDSRITWQIPEASDATIKIYETNFRLTHGDQFRGGSGISGMLAPLMIGHSRKTTRQNTLRMPYDWLVMGHWHDYWTGKGIIVNGSVKGYDEYAYVSNFPFQAPIQASWIVTPEHGLTFPMPIFAKVKDEEKRLW